MGPQRFSETCILRGIQSLTVQNPEQPHLNWHHCEKKPPEAPFKVVGEHQPKTVRAIYQICTLPYYHGAAEETLKYLWKRAQKTFSEENKNIWWVSLKEELTGFHQAERLLYKPILQVFQDFGSFLWSRLSFCLCIPKPHAPFLHSVLLLSMFDCCEYLSCKFKQGQIFPKSCAQRDCKHVG